MEFFIIWQGGYRKLVEEVKKMHLFLRELNFQAGILDGFDNEQRDDYLVLVTKLQRDNFYFPQRETKAELDMRLNLLMLFHIQTCPAPWTSVCALSHGLPNPIRTSHFSGDSKGH